MISNLRRKSLQGILVFVWAIGLAHAQSSVLPTFGPFVKAGAPSRRGDSLPRPTPHANLARGEQNEIDTAHALLKGSALPISGTSVTTSAPIPLEYRNILDAAGPGWTWFVESHFDKLKLYPWKAFDMKGGPALAYASIENGQQVAYVATDMPAFQVAQDMVHEAGHFHALCEKLDFQDQEYARMFERAFVRDYQTRRGR